MATIPDTAADALSEFHDVWSRQLAADVGGRLTCKEVDVLADLFTATGRADLAAVWIEHHGYSDDEGDSHYPGKRP